MENNYIIAGCTRCKGTLEIKQDEYGKYYRCVNCGEYKFIGSQIAELKYSSDGKLLRGSDRDATKS